jgi:hypothetical protein
MSSVSTQLLSLNMRSTTKHLKTENITDSLLSGKRPEM